MSRVWCLFVSFLFYSHLNFLRGGLVDDMYFPKGECTYPYEGNLCNQCTGDYAKFGCIIQSLTFLTVLL